MKANREQLSVKLDVELVQAIKQYCEVYALDENDLIQDALHEFMATRQAKVDHVINGYAEMASINSQIAAEFNACESEAYAHIRIVD
ncbi:hypothetical protein GKC32_07610 [Lactobacillus curvatus]|uniref:hypothetical protein n=1 Tax=Latilactobacillus fragifolii TaxID=2814244 RepID=UPI0012B0512F|nr:hypothetical protein [Latilactobacillus fragifolii]MSD84016.1 hypothetical protein [Latilactobacillus curvatus]MSE24336.1 hypothetical protein [Latilactobacillus curvatus]